MIQIHHEFKFRDNERIKKLNQMASNSDGSMEFKGEQLFCRNNFFIRCSVTKHKIDFSQATT